MENAEEVLHYLEEFSKRKTKIIPQELNDYLVYVARTGDPVYQWSLVKSLFKEKLLNVITDFFETSPGIDIPPYPNVDPFNYDIMKNSLLERLDSFTAAPFTIQRICELLTFPRKQYNRIDKFMRAVEKNILVVSTREPGAQRHAELDNGEPLEAIVNGSDNNSEYNVDVEMEDMSWKENTELRRSSEPQPSSSDTHISVDDIETRLQDKPNTSITDTQITPIHFESAAVVQKEDVEQKPEVDTMPVVNPITPPENEIMPVPVAQSPIAETEQTKPEIEANDPLPSIENSLVIPEITVDDAEMTEAKLSRQASMEINDSKVNLIDTPPNEPADDIKELEFKPQMSQPIDENSSESLPKDEVPESKPLSDVSTSSEESSSSSENTDGNSDSPKIDSDGNSNINVNEESSQSDASSEEVNKEIIEEPKIKESSQENLTEIKEIKQKVEIQSENYSITDVSSELAQPVNNESNEKLEEPACNVTPTTDEDKAKESNKDDEVNVPSEPVSEPMKEDVLL